MKSKSYQIFPLKKLFRKTIILPGSKSFTNRALAMAALTQGRTVLKGASKSDDSLAMISALKKLGIKIKSEKNQLAVYGNGGHFRIFKGKLNIGAAGTALRFLLSLSALIPGEIILDGSDQIRRRPIGVLVRALKSLGAEIAYLGRKSFPPVAIKGGKIQGGAVKMSGNTSSQFITSLLLIAPALKKGLLIKTVRKPVSESYLVMTMEAMKERGIKARHNNCKQFIVRPGNNYRPGKYAIEGDSSGGSYFMALAALTGSTVRVKNLRPDSSQGDARFCDLLRSMGCQIKKNARDQWIEVRGKKSLKGISANMNNMPDATQTLAVVAAFAKGATKLSGLSTLKHKETDRLQALKNELKKIGVRSEITKNSITVHGGRPHGAVIQTYEDHRMAMAFAIAGARIPGIIIKNPSVVAKSFPEFWDILTNIGLKAE